MSLMGQYQLPEKERGKAQDGRRWEEQKQSIEAPGDQDSGQQGPFWLPQKIVMGIGQQCVRPWACGCLRVLGAGGGWVGRSTSKSLCLIGGAVAQQVPVQAIQVHQAPQQASPSRDSSTDLTQTSSSGTGIA